MASKSWCLVTSLATVVTDTVEPCCRSCSSGIFLKSVYCALCNQIRNNEIEWGHSEVKELLTLQLSCCSITKCNIDIYWDYWFTDWGRVRWYERAVKSTGVLAHFFPRFDFDPGWHSPGKSSVQTLDSVSPDTQQKHKPRRVESSVSQQHSLHAKHICL